MDKLTYLQNQLEEANSMKVYYSKKESLPWWEEVALENINKEIACIIDLIGTVKAFDKITTLKTA